MTKKIWRNGGLQIRYFGRALKPTRGKLTETWKYSHGSNIGSSNYRLLTKYREICPPPVVVRQGPELAFLTFLLYIQTFRVFIWNKFVRKFSFKHNNKGTVSRKGECSIVHINRLQQFCTATDCKPSQNTKFTTLQSPLLHPIHISKANSVSRDELTSHDPFLGQRGHVGTHQKAMPPAVTHMSTKLSVVLVHHLTSVFWLYWIVRSFL